MLRHGNSMDASFSKEVLNSITGIDSKTASLFLTHTSGMRSEYLEYNSMTTAFMVRYGLFFWSLTDVFLRKMSFTYVTLDHKASHKGQLLEIEMCLKTA